MTDEKRKPNPDLLEETFPKWKTEPIVPSLIDLLKGKGFQRPEGTVYFVPKTSQEYEQIKLLAIGILENLPFNNEIGDTRLMREDAKKVVSEIIEALQGKKSWEEIQWLFKSFGYLEVFKNLVYPKHNIPSAICYNVDLTQSGLGADHNAVKIDRYHLINNENGFSGTYDGSFSIASDYIIFDADQRSLDPNLG